MALSNRTAESLTHLQIRKQVEQKQLAEARSAAARERELATHAEAQARAAARKEFESELAAITTENSSSKERAGAFGAAAAVTAKVAEAKSVLLQNRQQLASMEDTTAEMAAGAQDFASMAAQLNRRP
eukprot:COSAG02_NODE_1380_length_12986_cov_13.843563_11_plen_128_part_00